MRTSDAWAEVASAAAALLDADPAAFAAFVRSLQPAEVDALERVLADRRAAGWRADPASFAAHLTGGAFQRWGYVRLLAEEAVAAVAGVRPRQLWNLPSQYGKTTLLRWVVLWALDADPTRRVMYVTYDTKKAHDEAGMVRDLAEQFAGQLSFRLRPDRRARGAWSTPQGGGVYAAGVNAAITGYPADVLIADDLLKGWQAAHSPAIREHTMAVYRSQMRMRLQRPTDPIIVAGTRWHMDDPTGVLLADPEDTSPWHHVRLPAIAEEHDPKSRDPFARLPDPLGRAPGEPLEPARFPVEEVLARQRALGSYLWAALEQQRPTPEEGGEIKRGWWRWYSARPARFDKVVSSWDTKLKDRRAGDHTCGQVWGRTGGTFWLLDAVRGQWSQALTRVAVAWVQHRWPDCRQHLVENAGYGPEVMEQLRKADPDYTLSDATADDLGVPTGDRAAVQALVRRGVSGLTAVPPKGSKVVRARAVSPLIEAGDVRLPEGADFALSLVDECAAFPDGAHDDQVDAMSQALARMSHAGSSVAAPPRQQVRAPSGVAAIPGRPSRRGVA